MMGPMGATQLRPIALVMCWALWTRLYSAHSTAQVRPVSRGRCHWTHWIVDTCPLLDTCPCLGVSSGNCHWTQALPAPHSLVHKPQQIKLSPQFTLLSPDFTSGSHTPHGHILINKLSHHFFLNANSYFINYYKLSHQLII